MDISSSITFIIVSSPSPCHPSMELLERVIASLSCFPEVKTPNILIVLDGFNIAPHNRTKKGRVTAELAGRYLMYCNAAEDFVLARGMSTTKAIRCPEHFGFAMAVKFGLESCTTQYAMIIQQDRVFLRKVCFLGNLLEAFERHDHIRYIGFPTSASKSHPEQLVKRYCLRMLTDSDACIPLSAECFPDCSSGTAIGSDVPLFLQPLIFWYDSNHLCHVQRYLEIYSPYKCVPLKLKQLVGVAGVKEMLLRKGDFIEDRFGQFQRNYLIALSTVGKRDSSNSVCASDLDTNGGEISLRTELQQTNESVPCRTKDTKISRITSAGIGECPHRQLDSEICETCRNAIIVDAFRWFGSYLIWTPEYFHPPSTLVQSEDLFGDGDLGSSGEVTDSTDECHSVENLRESTLFSSSRDNWSVAIFVGHLRGRHFNPELRKARLAAAQSRRELDCTIPAIGATT